jgi:hypothetical protein
MVLLAAIFGAASGAAGGTADASIRAGGAMPTMVAPRVEPGFLAASGALWASAGAAAGAAGGAGDAGAAGGAGEAAGAGTAAPNPSIVLLKSACTGAVLGGGGCTGVGGGGAGGAGPASIEGVAGAAAGATAGACNIVRVRTEGTDVKAPHCPQNCACSGKGCPHWVQVRVVIEPVRLGVAV